MQLELLACGTVNLTLDVVGILPCGYHRLDMCLTTIDIGDSIAYTTADEIVVRMNGIFAGDENIVYRVLQELVTQGILRGGRVDITKGLPISSGMGGSSCDAAAVLYAAALELGVGRVTINSESSELDAYRLDWHDDRYRRLESIAAAYGSDIAFIMRGGLARATGKGDDLTVMEYIPLKGVMIVADGGAMTSQVFRIHDDIQRRKATASGGLATNALMMTSKDTGYTASLIAAINENSRLEVGNALTEAAEIVNPNIAEAIRDLRRFSSRVCMTGSGSGVYGLFDSESEIAEAIRQLSAKYLYIKRLSSTPCGILEKKRNN